MLPAALLLTWGAVEIAKAASTARGRRSRCRDDRRRLSLGHAAYAVFYVACAIVLVRAGSALAARFAVVTLALVLAVALALSRVLLRANHLSDVEGGAGLAAAVLAALGLLAIAVARLRHNVRPEP